MIFFCEDCGEKNILSPTQLKDGKAIFRCKSCRYLNSYRIHPVEKPFLKITEDVLNPLRRFPEIIGSFLFHRETGMLTNNMPDILKETDLDILGKILTQNYWVCHAQYPDIHEMVLIISNKNIMVKMIDRNLALIIVCKIFPLSKNCMDQLDQLVDGLGLTVRTQKG